jgi:hypothetical protein
MITNLIKVDGHYEEHLTQTLLEFNLNSKSI